MARPRAFRGGRARRTNRPPARCNRATDLAAARGRARDRSPPTTGTPASPSRGSSRRNRRRAPGCEGSAAEKSREKPEKLDIEPDEGHEERKGRVPLHVFRRAGRHPALDEIEVEQKVVLGHSDGQDGPGECESTGNGQSHG